MKNLQCKVNTFFYSKSQSKSLWARYDCLFFVNFWEFWLGHKSVLVFAPDVTGLTTGQALNMMTHNRERTESGRERDGKMQKKYEANYLYHPSSQSFKGYIKIQSVIPRQRKMQLVELCLRVRDWIHVCLYTKKSEARFRPLLLRLAAGKVCNEELPALTFMLWLSAAPFTFASQSAHCMFPIIMELRYLLWHLSTTTGPKATPIRVAF